MHFSILQEMFAAFGRKCMVWSTFKYARECGRSCRLIH